MVAGGGPGAPVRFGLITWLRATVACVVGEASVREPGPSGPAFG
jgi:hypothetical protein